MTNEGQMTHQIHVHQWYKIARGRIIPIQSYEICDGIVNTPILEVYTNPVTRRQKTCSGL